MDIRISDMGAGLLAVGHIFGDDISTGPRRPIPDWLRPYVEHLDFYPKTIELRPAAKGLMPTVDDIIGKNGGWELVAHRVVILVKGSKIGEALRMDDASLRAMASFERSVLAAERRGA